MIKRCTSIITYDSLLLPAILTINGYMSSYFQRTVNIYCYTSSTLTALIYTSKFNLYIIVHRVDTKMFAKMWGDHHGVQFHNEIVSYFNTYYMKCIRLKLHCNKCCCCVMCEFLEAYLIGLFQKYAEGSSKGLLRALQHDLS